MSQDQPLAVGASLESVTGGVAPAAVCDAPARDAEREIRAGEMAPWTLGELPEPPTVQRGILAMLGAALLGHLPGALPTSYLPADEVARRTGVEVRVAEQIKADPKRFGDGAGQTPLPQPIVEQMQRETTLRNWLAYAIFVAAFVPL